MLISLLRKGFLKRSNVLFLCAQFPKKNQVIEKELYGILPSSRLKNLKTCRERAVFGSFLSSGISDETNPQL